MKLFDADKSLTEDYKPLFMTVYEHFKLAFSGNSRQFFHNVDFYLDQVPSFKTEMAQRAKQYLWSKTGSSNEYRTSWFSSSLTLDFLSENYLALLDILNHFVCVGVDMHSPNMASALYTRDYSLLQRLYAEGYLAQNPELFLEVLAGSKTARSLNSETFVALRLDLETRYNGKPVFSLSVPRSNLAIGLGKRYVLIPVPSFYLFEYLLRQLFQSSPYRFVIVNNNKPRTHFASHNPAVVKSVYFDSETELIDLKINKVETGYDPVNRCFYTYDLEDSVYSSGVIGFRPELLDELAPVSVNEINRSYHNIDFNLLRGIFKTRVHRLSSASLDTLGFLDLSSYANKQDKLNAVAYALERTSNAFLYNFMMTNQNIFGDLEERLQARRRLVPKFLKQAQPVKLRGTLSERVEQFKTMIYHGVVHFVAINKSGSFFEVKASNNRGVLARLLGKDYVRLFESPKHRLLYVRRQIVNGQVANLTTLQKLASAYNLAPYCELEDFLSKKNLTSNFAQALSAIDEGLAYLKDRLDSRPLAEGVVVYRNVEAFSAEDFYGNVNIETLLSLQYSPYNPKVKPFKKERV